MNDTPECETLIVNNINISTVCCTLWHANYTYLVSTKSTRANNNLILFIQFNHCYTCITTPLSLLIYLKFPQCAKEVSTSNTTTTKQKFAIFWRLTIYWTNLWVVLITWSDTSPSIKINSLSETYLNDRIKFTISNPLDQGSQIESKLETYLTPIFFFLLLSLILYCI